MVARREATAHASSDSMLYVTFCRGTCSGQGLVRPLVTGDDTVVLMCDECDAIWFQPEAISQAPAEYASGPFWTLRTGQSIEPGTTRWASLGDINDLTDWDPTEFHG